MVALAQECFERRMDLMRRGASYPGPTRVRMGGVGEAMALYERLNPDDSTIIHLATGPIREKASAQRVIIMRKMEHEIVDFVEGILLEAIAQGELKLPPGAPIQEMAFAHVGARGRGLSSHRKRHAPAGPRHRVSRP